MDPFDDYMLKHVRALKAIRERYRAASTKRAVLAILPELSAEDRDAVIGEWPREFDRILAGESATMIAEDAKKGLL